MQNNKMDTLSPDNSKYVSILKENKRLSKNFQNEYLKCGIWPEMDFQT
jgi:hypothetical protein